MHVQECIVKKTMQAEDKSEMKRGRKMEIYCCTMHIPMQHTQVRLKMMMLKHDATLTCNAEAKLLQYKGLTSCSSPSTSTSAGWLDHCCKRCSRGSSSTTCTIEHKLEQNVHMLFKQIGCCSQVPKQKPLQKGQLDGILLVACLHLSSFLFCTWLIAFKLCESSGESRPCSGCLALKKICVV